MLAASTLTVDSAPDTPHTEPQFPLSYNAHVTVRPLAVTAQFTASTRKRSIQQAEGLWLKGEMLGGVQWGQRSPCTQRAQVQSLALHMVPRAHRE